MAHFSVYRTYAQDAGISAQDIAFIQHATSEACKTAPDLIYELKAIEKLLLTQKEKEPEAHFTRRFQQVTVPLMAKGAEDTAFYTYNRLISTNEVGGWPDQFGLSIDAFHSFNQKRAENYPHTLNTTSTHDTKRGEDTRARINILSEIPEEWKQAVRSWHTLNKQYRSKNAPSKNDEYLIYQTLLGAYPFFEQESKHFIERMKEYIIKVVREAKVHTAWLKPDIEYERACTCFIDNILKSDAFLNAFLPLHKKTAYLGIFNSLSQVLLKLASPGVPDIYQGTETWDLSLVDPDNRRAVDYEQREQCLTHFKEHKDLSTLIRDLFTHAEDGRIKFFLLYRLLQARNERKNLFQNSHYIPLTVRGTHENNIIAFARTDNQNCMLCLAPRFVSQLIGNTELPFGQKVWLDTNIILPKNMPSEWIDCITGQTIHISEKIEIGSLITHFPGSLLIAAY